MGIITGIEIPVGRIGAALVKQLALSWFAEKKADSRRGKDLTALIRARFPLPRKDRDVLSALWEVEDEVAKRLAPTCARLAHGLPENEVTAALDAVADTLEEADLSDEVLFAHDLDPTALHEEIRRNHPLAAQRAGLGERSAALYDAALHRACVVMVHLARELPEFQGATATEELRRLTSISAKLDAVLDRLGADRGEDQDEAFRRKYLAFLASALDKLELLGLSMRHRPRLALSMAYLSLGANDEDRRARRPGGREDHAATRVWFEKTSDAHRGGVMRVETALSWSPRTLVRR